MEGEGRYFFSLLLSVKHRSDEISTAFGPACAKCSGKGCNEKSKRKPRASLTLSPLRCFFFMMAPEASIPLGVSPSRILPLPLPPSPATSADGLIPLLTFPFHYC